MNKARGKVKVTFKVNGHEFDLSINKLHSEWQLRSLFNVMMRIFNKALNTDAVKGAEEILKKGR